MENSNETTQNKVMEQINTGQVKLRSKYLFLAEKFSIGSGIILSVLLAIFFLSLLFYYLRATDNIIYLSFGESGLLAFLESFPYLLVTAFIACVLLAGALLKMSGSVYRQPFKYIALILVGGILVVGIGLTLARVDRIFEKNMYLRSRTGIIVQPLLQPGLNERNRGIAGRVVEIMSPFMTLQTPRGLQKVDISQVPSVDTANLATGMFVVGIGQKQEGLFLARHVRQVAPGKTRIIEGGVNRRFGPLPPLVPMQALP